MRAVTLPDRRSIRLKGFDYSRAGLYFVTVCAHAKRCIFGAVADGQVRLNSLGALVQECWVQIPYHFARVELDAFVIMPNHLHGVLLLNPDRRAQHAAPLQPPSAARAENAKDAEQFLVNANVAPRSLAAVIRSFKAGVTRLAPGRGIGYAGPVWQRNYYEHILRNGDDLSEIRRYIAEDPARWETDKDNPLASPRL